MFIPCSEKQGSAYFEFQYCKKEWNVKKLLKRGYSFWKKDSLFFNADFRLPNIIKIVDDSANRNFITCDGAIGWIEKHEDVDVLHMYAEFVAKCGISFIPISQIDKDMIENKKEE